MLERWRVTVQGKFQYVNDIVSDTISLYKGHICLGKRDTSAQRILMVINKF